MSERGRRRSKQILSLGSFFSRSSHERCQVLFTLKEFTCSGHSVLHLAQVRSWCWSLVLAVGTALGASVLSARRQVGVWASADVLLYLCQMFGWKCCWAWGKERRERALSRRLFPPPSGLHPGDFFLSRAAGKELDWILSASFISTSDFSSRPEFKRCPLCSEASHQGCVCSAVFPCHPEMCCSWHRKQEVKPKTPNTVSPAALLCLVHIKPGASCTFSVPNGCSRLSEGRG